MKKCAVAVTGARGEGKDTGVPAIGGQHYRYLLARPRNFSYGHRGAGNLQLLESIGGITTSGGRECSELRVPSELSHRRG